MLQGTRGEYTALPLSIHSTGAVGRMCGAAECGDAVSPIPPANPGGFRHGFQTNEQTRQDKTRRIKWTLFAKTDGFKEARQDRWTWVER